MARKKENEFTSTGICRSYSGTLFQGHPTNQVKVFLKKEEEKGGPWTEAQLHGMIFTLLFTTVLSQ